jgi:cation diffusion facilitator family transporter
MSAAGPEHHTRPEPASGSPKHNHDPVQRGVTAGSDQADSHHPSAPDHHLHSASDEHAHPSGLRGLLANIFQPHSHDAADSVDDALAGSAAGIRAVKLSLVGLGLTAALQLVVVLISNSAALLADTIHNFADAATAIPLWLAFAVGRRPPTRRYSYGFGRAEDLAGVFVVLMIAASAVLAAWESLEKLLNPQPIHQLGWVAAAAVVGCLGNELVAQYRIRTGQRIGSAALVADGYHARTDGLTSLAVLLGVVGVWLGFPQADPLVGLGITVAILFVLKNAMVQIWQRLMDAIDPTLLERAEAAARAVPGVQSVDAIRARWIGHTIHGEGWLTVDRDLTLAAAHEIAEQARHAMLHAVPKLASVTIHVDPCSHDGSDPHGSLAHHRQVV